MSTTEVWRLTEQMMDWRWREKCVNHLVASAQTTSPLSILLLLLNSASNWRLHAQILTLGGPFCAPLGHYIVFSWKKEIITVLSDHSPNANPNKPKQIRHTVCWYNKCLTVLVIWARQTKYVYLLYGMENWTRQQNK